MIKNHDKLVKFAMEQGYMYYNEFTKMYYDDVNKVHIPEDEILVYFEN